MAGLTTALALQETGRYLVSVLAETFPSDLKRADYTSPWAVYHLFALESRVSHEKLVLGRAPGIARWRGRESAA